MSCSYVALGITDLEGLPFPVSWFPFIGQGSEKSALDQASQLTPQGHGYRFKVSNIHKGFFYLLVSFKVRVSKGQN